MSFTTLRHALLYNPGSLFSNVGVLLLCEKGVRSQYALTPIDMQHDNNTAGFLRLNPMGKVPVLIHDGQAIPDTLAMARFLDPSNDLLSQDAKAVALVERWRQVRVVALWIGKKRSDQDTSLMEAQLTKARERIDREATVRLAAHDDRAHILLSHTAYLHHRQQWQRLLDDSEDALAQHQPYLLDKDRFSLVDIYATSFLFWYLQKVDPSAETVFTGRRRLEQYYYRQLDRSSVRDAFNLS
ncbi:hypothetical protein [Absidia glauca]|uniref:GST N-terminal domain-containing protein n=1 Tax=Absidia glauca TaxID=4829 RepID=A0A163K194_ABSGL|nr:hypothetical protein [Absidia glauca]